MRIMTGVAAPVVLSAGPFLARAPTMPRTKSATSGRVAMSPILGQTTRQIMMPGKGSPKRHGPKGS